MARLIFRDSQGREGTVELSANETVYVGRGLECAIRTDDGMVSRRHAQFRSENGRFVVEDLGSANGTHLNNIRIQKQALGHTDVIQCGSLVIRFLDRPYEDRTGSIRPEAMSQTVESIDHMALRFGSWDQVGQFKRFLSEVAPALGG